MDKVIVGILLLSAWAATVHLGRNMLRYTGTPATPSAPPGGLPRARVVADGAGRTPPTNLALGLALAIVYASVAVMFVWPLGVLVSVLR